MTFGWGAALLAFITAQRIAELWWAKQNERRLFAAGGIEFGRPHLFLIVFLHAAWIIGLWMLGHDRSVNPFFLVVVVAVPGETLVALGPHRFLRHPNYAVVAGEFAAVPLALGLPIYALVFTVLNAAVLAIRIPEENAALAATVRGAGLPRHSDFRGSPMVG
jgi:methyltransferase